jgi:hypothetical protein
MENHPAQRRCTAALAHCMSPICSSSDLHSDPQVDRQVPHSPQFTSEEMRIVSYDSPLPLCGDVVPTYLVTGWRNLSWARTAVLAGDPAAQILDIGLSH